MPTIAAKPARSTKAQVQPPLQLLCSESVHLHALYLMLNVVSRWQSSSQNALLFRQAAAALHAQAVGIDTSLLSSSV